MTNGRSSSPSILSRGSEPAYRANDFVNDAYGIKLTPNQVQKYAADYAEVHRAEMLRVSELENLKSGNASLAAQIKRLEQSLAELNREHIELANAMVQGKMENAKLADENEALREEVVQLKQVIDGQPAEVEAKLKDEMDRIMERNLEVMSMNRELEEQVGELEKQLVETKLQFAQVTAGACPCGKLIWKRFIKITRHLQGNGMTYGRLWISTLLLHWAGHALHVGNGN